MDEWVCTWASPSLCCRAEESSCTRSLRAYFSSDTTLSWISVLLTQLLNSSISLGEREREIETEREKYRERERSRQREINTQREREREKNTGRERERNTKNRWVWERDYNADRWGGTQAERMLFQAQVCAGKCYMRGWVVRMLAGSHELNVKGLTVLSKLIQVSSVKDIHSSWERESVCVCVCVSSPVLLCQSLQCCGVLSLFLLSLHHLSIQGLSTHWLILQLRSHLLSLSTGYPGFLIGKTHTHTHRDTQGYIYL